MVRHLNRTKTRTRRRSKSRSRRRSKTRTRRRSKTRTRRRSKSRYRRRSKSRSRLYGGMLKNQTKPKLTIQTRDLYNIKRPLPIQTSNLILHYEEDENLILHYEEDGNFYWTKDHEYHRDGDKPAVVHANGI